jgi:hypothetical protein
MLVLAIQFIGSDGEIYFRLQAEGSSIAIPFGPFSPGSSDQVQDALLKDEAVAMFGEGVILSVRR